MISGKQAHEIINVNQDDKDIVNESARMLRSNKLSDKNNASQCRLVRTCRSNEPVRCCVLLLLWTQAILVDHL